jgi:cell wall-associated NlpC family hydrolase
MLNPTLDPRINAYRPDLADSSLRGEVTAARYVEPMLRQCVRGVVPMLAEPNPNARQTSQVRYGEFVDVFEFGANGMAWVQNRTDRYVGYIPTEGVLTDTIANLSHRLTALRSFVYPEPDLKSPPMDELTLGAHLHLRGGQGNFTELASGGFVFTKHIASAPDTVATDYIFTAGRMLGAPYLWGGRTPKGIDCSGLVQLTLDMAGFDVPRDSDQQREAFGHPLPCHWRDMVWKRGDVVFFPGHVGIMTGTDHMIHANAFAMAVTVEPLQSVVERGVEILAMGKPDA